MNPQQMGQSLAGKFKHQFIYGLIALGGRTLAYGFLYPLVFCYTCTPSVFKKSRAYILRRFAPKTKWQFWVHTYRLNLTFARTLVDRAALGILGRTQITSTPAQQEQLAALARGGKGLVLLSAHAGCWQLAVNQMHTFLPTRVHVLYYRSPHDHDKTVSAHQHKQPPYTFINPAGPGGGLIEMMVALQQGHTVCAMADRVFGNPQNTLSVQFLGGRIYVPYSFYRVAGSCGAPVAVVFFPWEGKGVCSVCTFPAFFVPDSGPAKTNYQRFAQRFASALEEFCIKYPYQFFNYYNLWEPEK